MSPAMFSDSTAMDFASSSVCASSARAADSGRHGADGFVLADDALLERAQRLEAVQHAASPGAGVLGWLATQVPQGLQLTLLALEGPALRLEGVAQGRAPVTELLHILGQAPGLGDIRLREIKAASAGDEFQVSAQVRP